MKLSAMKVPQLAATMAKIAPAIGNIMTAPAVGKFFEQYANKELTPQLGLAGLANILPALLDSNYEDTVKIICVLTEHTKEEVEDMTIVELIPAVKGILDAELLKLFH